MRDQAERNQCAVFFFLEFLRLAMNGFRQRTARSKADAERALPAEVLDLSALRCARIDDPDDGAEDDHHHGDQPWFAELVLDHLLEGDAEDADRRVYRIQVSGPIESEQSDLSAS